MSRTRPARPVLVAGAALVLVVALVIVAALVGIGPFAPAPTPARVGQVVDTGAWNPDEVPDDIAEAEIGLPPGDLVLRVGKPRTELPTLAGSEQAGVAKPDGGTFVPVSWRWSAPSIRPDVNPNLNESPSIVAAPPPQPTLGIEVDDEVLPLSVDVPASPLVDPDSTWFYVAVDGDEQTFVVGYDSVEVRVTGSEDGLEVDGAPQGYEDYQRDRSGDNPAIAEFAPVLDPVATLQGSEPALQMSVRSGSREPYVGGLGWAPEGTTWVALTFDLSPADLVRRGEEVWRLETSEWIAFDEVDLTLTAGGVALDVARRPLPSLGGHLGGPTLAVVQVPQGLEELDLTATATMPARSVEPEGAPDPGEISLSWSGQVPIS